MKKRGGTHVGVVLSFVIFVTFLVFLYTSLQPAIDVEKSKQVVLDFLEQDLSEEMSAQLTTISLKIDEDYDWGEYKDADCVVLEEIEGFGGEEALVKRIDSGSELITGSGLSGDYVMFELGIVNYDSFKLFYSEEPLEFKPIGFCNEVAILEEENYNLAVRNKDYIFASKISDLISEYESGSLQSRLNVPEGTDFTFSFENQAGSLIEPIDVNIPTTSVYSDEIPIQYINQTASINTGFITIRVW